MLWREGAEDPSRTSPWGLFIWLVLTCTLYNKTVTRRMGFPGGKRFDPWVGKIPWRRKWQPTPGLLPGKSHGQRSLEGYCSWGRLATKQQKPEGQPYQQTVETDRGRENLPDLWPIGQNCGWAGDRQSVAGV